MTKTLSSGHSAIVIKAAAVNYASVMSSFVDPAPFHSGADPNPAFHYDADAHGDPDPDPAYHFNADLDSSHTDADPCGSECCFPK